MNECTLRTILDCSPFEIGFTIVFIGVAFFIIFAGISVCRMR